MCAGVHGGCGNFGGWIRECVYGSVGVWHDDNKKVLGELVAVRVCRSEGVGSCVECRCVCGVCAWVCVCACVCLCVCVYVCVCVCVCV